MTRVGDAAHLVVRSAASTRPPASARRGRAIRYVSDRRLGRCADARRAVGLTRHGTSTGTVSRVVPCHHFGNQDTADRWVCGRREARRSRVAIARCRGWVIRCAHLNVDRGRTHLRAARRWLPACEVGGVLGHRRGGVYVNYRIIEWGLRDRPGSHFRRLDRGSPGRPARTAGHPHQIETDTRRVAGFGVGINRFSAASRPVG